MIYSLSLIYFLQRFWGGLCHVAGEGNGTPLQYSCLENPMVGGAWWAAVYGVAQSQTRLKQLSSSSMPCGMRDLNSLTRDGKSWSLHWECRVLTIGQPGNPSLIYFLKFVIHCHTLCDYIFWYLAGRGLSLLLKKYLAILKCAFFQMNFRISMSVSLKILL